MENSQLQLGQHKREKSDGEKWCKAEHHSNINKTVPPSPVSVCANTMTLKVMSMTWSRISIEQSTNFA